MSVYDAASDAFERGDLDAVRDLLSPLVDLGDLEARTALGTYLTLESATYSEGLQVLRVAADQSYGHAAHNLATALLAGGPGLTPDRDGFLHYMEIAFLSGFEATVSSDPLWWKAKYEQDEKPRG